MENVEQMAREEIRRLGLESAFPMIHHFIRDEFRSPPCSLAKFLEYCDGPDLRDQGENTQTICRALTACDNVTCGMSRENAIAAAWVEHPLATR